MVQAINQGMFTNQPSTFMTGGTSDMGINIDIDIPNLPSNITEIISENRYEQYGDRLYPYVYTARRDDLNTGQSRGPLDGISIEMLSAQDLYARYAQDDYAQRAFGSFENYIGYLGDLLDLAEEHPEIAWWEDYGFRNLTAGTVATAEFYGLEPEDARSGSGALIDAESANLADANEAFEAMLALPEFRQLVADRGIETQFRLSENDIYVFNGLTATEVHEGADTFGAAFEQAMNLANSLALSYMTGMAGNAAISALQDAATLGTLGPYSSSIGRVLDLMTAGDSASALEAATILNEIGPVIVNLGDDTQVEDPLAEAEEEDVAFDPLLTGDPGDFFEPDIPSVEDPFESVEQEGVSVEEFEAIFGEDVINEDIVESGMYTDPETGTVYAINFPPDFEIPEDTDGGGGGGAEAPTDVEGEPTTDQPEPEPEPVIPDYSDLTSPEFEIPDMPQGETGIPDFYEVDEEGNVTTVLDPDTPLDPDNIPPWVDTDTPGTYPESGYVTDEQEETTVPTLSEPSIVITPSVPAPAPAPVPTQPTEETEPTPTTEQPTEQPTPTEEAPETPEQPGTETPSDTPTTGTDETGTAGEGDGTGTGTGIGIGIGIGTGTGTGTGDGTGSGDGERKGMFKDKFTPFFTSIGYTPVQLQQQIKPDYARELDGMLTRLMEGRVA